MKEKRSKMVGKRELLHRFPTIEQSLYEQAEQLFPIRITRSWLLRENSPVGPLVKQALPDGAELEKYKESL